MAEPRQDINQVQALAVAALGEHYPVRLVSEDSITYHEALTDPQAIGELGPTECGLSCGRLLVPDEPWVVHDHVAEHVDCHIVRCPIPGIDTQTWRAER